MKQFTKCISTGIILLVLSCQMAWSEDINVVPLPMKVVEGKGVFNINKKTLILIDNNNPELKEIAGILAEKLWLSAGIRLEIKDIEAEFKTEHAIVFTTLEAMASLGKEGYSLDISTKQVYVKAATANGIFYGLQTLLQLLPPDIEKQDPVRRKYSLPCLSIEDKPRFGYRGMHLDVGRHLYPVAFIKKYIDLMAMYKLNTFHWHLTEDQGWRIEIKKFPRLTQIGSKRKGTQIGRTEAVDTIAYQGFYTQDEAREIVAYAAKKYITVIPEIEMPGHSVAALTAYPSLSCTGGPFEVRTKWGVSEDIFCAGNDSSFIVLQDILTEIMNIFPSPYIHIGGDEAPKLRWHSCPKCQARMKAEGLKDETELQSYFIKRIEKFLLSKNRRLIGWDEITEGGLAPEATVMAWRGIQAGIDAAKQGHDAIMTPVDYCYFDYFQNDPTTEPEGNGNAITLKTVYSYNPTPPVLTPEQAGHIIGVQGNVWTEHLKSTDDVEIKAFPRAIALSEVAWSQQESKNWDNFIARMQSQFQRLDKLGVKYSKGSMAADISTIRDDHHNLVVLNCETKGMDIRYTTNGSEPTQSSTLYSAPFLMLNTSVVKAALFSKCKMAGGVNHREIIVSKASGKTVTIIKPYSFKYPASGDQAMTDGLKGGNSYKSGWQGYEGCDMEFTVDLEQASKVHLMSLDFVRNRGDWVLFPETVTFSYSLDGKTWIAFDTIRFGVNKPGEREVRTARVKCNETVLRYIKVNAISPKQLPMWHEYKGEPCWIFADELIVE